MRLWFIFILFFSFALVAQTEDSTIDLGVGQQKVVNVKGLQRVAIGDPGVVDVQAIGSDQLIITAKKHGRTTLILWLTNGNRVSYTVRVSQLDPQGVVKDVALLLKDIEGIKIKVADQYIILDGEVYRAIDYIRIQKVMTIFPIVRSLVIVSPEAKKGIVMELERMFKENSLKDVRPSVICDMIFIEGFVSDERDKIKALSIAKSLGLKQSTTYQLASQETQQNASVQQGSGTTVVDDSGNIGQEFIDLITIGLKKMILLDVEFVEIKKNSQLKVGLDWINPDGGQNTFNGVFSSFYDITNPVTQVTTKHQSYRELYPVNRENYGFASFLNISANLNLFSNDGYSRILAKPKLLCASGEKASFLSGGEVPIVMCSGQAGCSVEFKKYGVLLDMNPVADNDGNIISKIKTEVSEPDWANAVQGVPAFKTRNVETTVTVHTGDTIVLSGLFRFDQQKAISKMAGVGHIPILGELFKSRDFQDGKSDVLIFVHPIIVKPDTPTIQNAIKEMRKRYVSAEDQISFSIFD